MPKEFLACPRCSCLKFYSRGQGGELTFFQVNQAYQAIATGSMTLKLGTVDFSPIYCAGCSWSGEMKDLI